MSTIQVRRNGPYAPLGANYADDDAIATLDLEENDRAELLYLRGLAYCARDPRTEGYISDIALLSGKVLRRNPGKKNTNTITDAATRLAQVGVWTRDGDGYRITAWTKWNKTWQEISRSRLKDNARKGGSGPEDDGNDEGSRPESVRNPGGFPTPRHVTAVHGTSRQITADQQHATTSAASGAADPASRHPAQALLDEHTAETGRALANGSRAALLGHISEALDRATPDQVRGALAEYRTRLNPKPGLLPHLIDDVIDATAAQALADDPTQDPDIQAWIAAEEAKRAAIREAAGA